MSESDGGSGSPRNRLFVIALVAVGLVIAAFALPAVNSGAGGGGGGGGGLTPPDGGGGPGSVDWDLPVEWVPEEGVELILRKGGELLVTRDGEGGEPYEGCAVIITQEPTPGSDVPIIVWNDGDTVEDVPVWFDGKLQGRTDANGQVVGTVSYSGELDIEVSVPGAETCVFVLDGEIIGRGESTEANPGLADLTGSATAHAVAGGTTSATPGDAPSAAQSTTAWATPDGAPIQSGTTPFGGGGAAGTASDAAGSAAATPTVAQTGGGNYSTSVSVEGEISIAVRGDPYPGEEVDIRATIEGEEVPEATVSVDGERQTETDDRGSATVILPEDGSERAQVTVERGDFSGSATIDLLIADIAVNPASPVPLPGQDAELVVTIGDRTVSNTTVLRNETTLGTTGPEGRLTTPMPVDPLTAFSTTVRGQTASTYAVWAYLPTLVLGLTLVFLLSGSLVAAAVGGRRWFVATVAAWVAFFTAIAGYVLGGTRGLGITLGSLAVIYLGIALVIYRKQAAAGATEGGRRLRSLTQRLVAWLRRRSPAEWVRHAALWVAGVLGRVSSAIVSRIRGHSVRSFLRETLRVPIWVAGALRRAGRRVVRTVPPALLVGSIALVGIVTGVTYYLEGPRAAGVAAVAMTGVVVLVSLLVMVVGGDDDDESADGEQSATVETTPTGTGTERENSVTLRRLWRTVARWVVPGRWQSKTPGEIARAAIERGYPEEPVEKLTRVFRDIEYGNRSMTADRWQATKDAFRQLARVHTQQEEEHDEQT